MKNFLLACTLSFAGVAFLGVNDADAKKKKTEDSTPLPKKEDVPRLLNTLTKSTSGADRANAATQIGRLGQVQAMYVKDCIDPLAEALKKDTDAEVRRASAQALGLIAPSPPEKYVPLLSDALMDKSLQVNLAAVTALGRYGPEAKSALPALREFAKTKGNDKKLKQMIAAALKEISGAKKK
jgi:HEAT repeat protein